MTIGQTMTAAVDFEQALADEVAESGQAQVDAFALDDGLGDAFENKHATERDDERLQVQPGDEQALGQAHQQCNRQCNGDARPKVEV